MVVAARIGKFRQYYSKNFLYLTEAGNNVSVTVLFIFRNPFALPGIGGKDHFC